MLGGVALVLLAAAAAAGSKGGGSKPPRYGAPVAPGGTAVTSMRAGQHYAVTVLFEPHFLNVDTPEQAAALFTHTLTAPNFVVDPALTQVGPNTDGTWSGKATALYTGGDVLLERPNGWHLLQLEAATGVSGYFFDQAVLGGDFFGDVAHSFQDVAKAVTPVLKPLKDIYDKIPTPVKAVLAPQTLITEYAYAHPEMIPMFGKQAAQAKALFEGLKGGKLDAQSAAAIAAQAIGPHLHLPPEVATQVAAAAHMAAAAHPLASQALQIAHASAAALHPAGVPHPTQLKAAPPPPARREIHLTLASHAAAGAPPPPVTLPPNPKAPAALARQGAGTASWEVHRMAV